MSNVFPLYEQRWGTGDNLVCKARRRVYRVGNQYKRRNPKRQLALLTRDKVFAGSNPPKFLESFSNFFLERTALEMFRWGCSDPARIRYTPMTKNGTSRPEKPRNGVLLEEGFNNYGGRGYDDFVPGEVIKTAPSGDETT